MSGIIREVREVVDLIAIPMPPRARPAAVLRRAGRDRPPIRGGEVRRRPAGRAEVEERREEEKGEEAEVVRDPRLAEGFEKGDKLQCQDIPLEALRRGVAVVVEGTYWGAKAAVAGVLQDLHVRAPRDIEASLKLQGTDEENLLKWASGNPKESLRVHLCGGACLDRLEADNLLHGGSICKRVGEDLPWMSNLVDAVDPVPRPAEAGLPGGEAVAGGGRDRGRERERDPAEKKVREKRKRKSRDRDRSRGRSKEKINLRGGAKKKLEDVLGGTGLSPDPKFRKRFANKAQKKTKKKKRSSSSSGSSSGGSSYSGESTEVFAEEHKIRRVAKKAPGLLAAQALKEMQGALLTSTGGIWHQEDSELQPLSIQYYRQAMAPRLQGAPSREALTLGFAIDLILQGRVAESADCLVQRLKSIELVSQGAAWQIAQRLEVLPPERPVLSTRSEAREAIKEQKEDSKTKSEASQSKGKGDGWRSSSWTESGTDVNKKGKDPKGRGKKGKQKEDPKKWEKREEK